MVTIAELKERTATLYPGQKLLERPEAIPIPETCRELIEGSYVYFGILVRVQEQVSVGGPFLYSDVLIGSNTPPGEPHNKETVYYLVRRKQEREEEKTFKRLADGFGLAIAPANGRLTAQLTDWKSKVTHFDLALGGEISDASKDYLPEIPIDTWYNFENIKNWSEKGVTVSTYGPGKQDNLSVAYNHEITGKEKQGTELIFFDKSSIIIDWEHFTQ